MVATFAAQPARARPSRDRHRHGGDPLHVGQHRQAEGRRAVASQHGRRREERRVLSRERAARHAPRGAAAVVRRRLQPAHHGVPRRRARRAAQLPAAARRAQRAGQRSASPASPPCRRCGSSSSQLEWPAAIAEHLRYFANTGGRMPRETLDDAAPRSCRRRKPFLMYGLTEAFRSTYLPPEEVDRRPDSIGKAIPNAEILVLRDGRHALRARRARRARASRRAGRHGLLERRREDRRALQAAAGVGGAKPAWCCPRSPCSRATPCAWTHEGFLYFVGRRDEMIKTSGYRVSPTEIEEVLYAHAAGRRSRRVRRCRIRRSGRRSSSSVTAGRRRGRRRGSTARRVPRSPARLHGAGRHRRARRAAAAQPERQDRPQGARRCSSDRRGSATQP